MLVREIMTSNVASCHVDSNLEAVALLMWNHDCGAIPVVDTAGRPFGLVTDRDIAIGCALNNRPLWDMRAGDLLDGRPLYACMENDEVTGALELMRNRAVRRLPVTDRSEELKGMLSMSNLIQLARERPDESTLSFSQLAEALKAVTAPYAEHRKTGAR